MMKLSFHKVMYLKLSIDTYFTFLDGPFEPLPGLELHYMAPGHQMKRGMALEPFDPTDQDSNKWVSGLDFFINGMPCLQTINVKDDQKVERRAGTYFT